MLQVLLQDLPCASGPVLGPALSEVQPAGLGGTQSLQGREAQGGRPEREDVVYC